MTAWADLLFGDGAILGFILINVILFAFSTFVNKFGYFAGITSLLMFFYYQDNLGVNSFDQWLGIAQVIFGGFYFILGLGDSR
jgi:hypothetical protein